MASNVEGYFTKFSEAYVEQTRYRFLWYRWLIDGIVRQVDKTGKTVDMGTGTGELAVRLAMLNPKSTVIGIDISPGMLAEARKRVRRLGLKNIRFKVGSADKPLPKADFFVSNLAVHHVKNKKKFLENAYKSLSPGGKIIIGDWFKPSVRYSTEVRKLIDKNPERAERFEKSFKEFIKVVREQGFEKDHPKEYLVCPLTFRDMMEDAGFKARIIKSPKFALAVVMGMK